MTLYGLPFCDDGFQSESFNFHSNGLQEACLYKAKKGMKRGLEANQRAECKGLSTLTKVFAFLGPWAYSYQFTSSLQAFL